TPADTTADFKIARRVKSEPRMRWSPPCLFPSFFLPPQVLPRAQQGTRRPLDFLLRRVPAEAKPNGTAGEFRRNPHRRQRRRHRLRLAVTSRAGGSAELGHAGQ